MSTTAPPPAATPAPPGTATTAGIKVVSHSNLFYWWPVWTVGFLMAILTFIDGTLMAIVPKGTTAVKKVDASGETRAAYVLPKGRQVPTEDPNDSESTPVNPRVHLSKNKNYGVIFCVVLLVCIIITNVPLRGMWSVVVIITVIMLSVIFALAGWWEYIFAKLHVLDIRINMGGYLFIAGLLFAAWMFTLMLFDQQIYIVFEPGQFKVCTEIGGGEKVYPTMGMRVERKQSDLFRHMILGLGSGDMVVKTFGAGADHFDLPNVLFIRNKMQRIDAMLQGKTGSPVG
jgi:hypothetical protein